MQLIVRTIFTLDLNLKHPFVSLDSNKIHLDPEEVEHNEDSDLGGDGDEEETKKEYIKKVYVAKPWICTSGADKEVEDQIIKPTRPLMQMRVSRKRREFA